MSEMIERVAKAMAEAAGFCWENCTQSQWKRDAKAGIEAMRQPTDAMLNAAMWQKGQQSYADVWQTMIDAALSAAKGET